MENYGRFDSYFSTGSLLGELGPVTALSELPQFHLLHKVPVVGSERGCECKVRETP